MSLRQRILAYHKRNTGVWIPKGEILRLVTQNTSYTSDNAGRRLREMAEDGDLQVKQVKGHAHYSYQPTKQTVTKIEIVDGMAVERLVEVIK